MTSSTCVARLEALRLTVENANRDAAEGRPQLAADALQEVLDEGGWPTEALQAVTHNLATAMRQVIRARLAAGETAGAEELVERVLAIPVPMPMPPERLHARAEILHHIGSDCMQARQYGLAVRGIRRAIALYPCPTFSNSLIASLDALRQPSVLGDYCDTLAPRDIAPHWLIACQPKSGSTFLRNVLCEVTGFREIYLCHHTELSAQDLFYPILLEFAAVPTVTHQHCRATAANIQLMQAFGIQPVVLVRNLHDVLVSLREYLSAGAIRGTRFEVDAWMQASPQRQIDQLIDLVVPWHLEFLASWQACDRERRLPMLWLSYAEMIADKSAALHKVLSFHRFAATGEQVAGAIAKVERTPERNRFNHGIEGRGRATLTTEQQHRIRRMADYFPSADFTPLGI